MNEQLYNAIIVLGVSIIGALGTLVTVLIAWLAKRLSDNTTITKQARDASNGRLSEVLNKLATERDRAQGLRWLVKERDDRIAYIVARLPEAQALMIDYRNQRTTRSTAADEAAAERHVLQD